MGRYYQLSKKITDEESEEILKEMKELDDVDSVELSKDSSCLMVATKDDQFSEVMGNAVNICSRVAGGLELSFSRFAIEAIG